MLEYCCTYQYLISQYCCTYLYLVLQYRTYLYLVFWFHCTCQYLVLQNCCTYIYLLSQYCFTFVPDITVLYIVRVCTRYCSFSFLYLLTIAVVFYLPVHDVMSLFYLHRLTTLPVCVHVRSSLTHLFLHCYHPQRQVSTFFFTSCGFFLPSITTHRCCVFSAFTQL